LGAPKIHGELLKLGFEIFETSVSRDLCRLHRRGDPGKSWLHSFTTIAKSSLSATLSSGILCARTRCSTRGLIQCVGQLAGEVRTEGSRPVSMKTGITAAAAKGQALEDPC
jgi:hypothetical protein